MKEKNHNILKEVIRKLPELKAPEGVWDSVEKKLKYLQAIHDLPEYLAPENAWEGVEKELDKAITRKRTKTILLLIRTSAAVIVFLLALYGIRVIIEDKSKNQDMLQELRTEMPDMNKMEETGFESIYNPALCRSNPQICNTPLFKSLDNELNVIKVEIEEMKPMVKGGDPQLLKYYYRLVNERTEIEKRLVKLIMQT